MPKKNPHNTNTYKILKFDSVTSTNVVATEMALKKEPEGTVIVADHQTAGRGQRLNKWDSEKGKNLTFSLILRPEFLLAEQQFLLLKSLSLAVCDYLNSINVKACIKWPNDIYIDNRKVAGMLIEHSIMGEYISFSIVGIGLNFNQESFNANVLNPISILQKTGKKIEVSDALNQLLTYIDRRYKMLKNNELATIDNDYFENLYCGKGFHLYEANGKLFKAKIAGISDTGELILKDECNTTLHFAFKEVSFILPSQI